MAETGPPTAKELWGDEKFADAIIIMEDKVWRIHRWVVCQQSSYFMNAYESEFGGSMSKTIDLSNEGFHEEAVNMMLKFLYTHELDNRQKTDPLTTAILAEHFKVNTLRTKALQELKGGLRNLIAGGTFVNFKRWALRILEDHGDTEIEQALVIVTAANLQAIVYNRILPDTWNDIVQKHPTFANKVLLTLVPETQTMGAAAIKRAAGAAFDDAYAFRTSRMKRDSFLGDY
ncbi:hypothetical protein VM1G_02291 [Cytospora mali]|uniref:BTB domain-containing protein n=1 Tax=Cytospora mali TaxID=578113 RepID=A0A194VS18_CYTMA|nr:hypothetical protein VM1G_02291 [Valsa mali]